MYEYEIYGYALRSEIELPLASRSTSRLADAITLTASPGNRFKQTVSCFWGNNYAELRTPSVQYYIYPAENRICAEWKNGPEDVICTLLNVPFSLLLFGKGELLVHCGCLEYNGALTAVAAAKGTGKTTLVTNAAKRINLFSDDTLRVTEELCGYGTAGLVKMTPETFDTLYSKQMKPYFRREDGKIYVFAKEGGLRVSDKRSGELKKILFLERNGTDSVEIRLIESKQVKEFRLLSSIVGVSLFDPASVRFITTMKVFRHVLENALFYKMRIPNDLRRLDENADALERIIRV